MIIELLDNPVSPWFGRWNEPEVDSILQTEANERPHAAGMSWTPIKGEFIVYLQILRDAHAHLDRIGIAIRAMWLLLRI